MSTILLSLDPSSTTTGWALWNGLLLLEAGAFRTKPYDDPLVRIEAECKDLRELIRKAHPDVVVIEATSGKTAGRLQSRQTSGLGIYGTAVGALWREAYWAVEVSGRVEMVYENEWTRGVSKAKRRALIAAELPEYAKAMDQDKGGDVADAIGLGRWWIARETRLAACGGCC